MNPQNNASSSTPAGPVPQSAPPFPAATATPAQPATDQSIADINQAGAAPLPAEAADTDNIEPEWVEKAKQVVRRTHDDPYRQIQELNKLRVDYMKKRYNKDITLTN